MWQKQIIKILEKDSESLLKINQNPDPMLEINFWKVKSENLNSIQD